MWWMSQQPGTGACHGKKRPAECDADDQPLTKRFGRLQIDPIAPPSPRDNGSSDQAGTGPNDTMMLDDTKHTVYIHDLDREIEEQDHEDGTLRILSGLGGGLSTMSGLFTRHTTPQCNELVLYRDPISLTVPKEVDNVRRALIETKERVRGEQSKLHKPQAATMGLVGGPTCYDTPQEDQMDVDDTVD